MKFVVSSLFLVELTNEQLTSPDLQTLNTKIGGQSLDDVESLSRQFQLNEDLITGTNVMETMGQPEPDQL